jgi:integrase/recombinase XerD
MLYTQAHENVMFSGYFGGILMRQAQTLNEAQLRRVLQYCQTRRHPLRDRTIVLVSFNAGLRAKEIAALTEGDVFDDTGAVREQFVLQGRQSKGGKARTVYLNQRLRRALAEYAAGLNLSDPNRALFESQKGGHFSANTMCQLFLDIYKAVGLKDASSHSGRRTYITRLANKGVGVRLLAALAGHSSIQVTQRYIDVNADQLAAAVELL